MADDTIRLEALIEANTKQYAAAMKQLLALTEGTSASSIAALSRLEKSVLSVGSSMFRTFAGSAGVVLAVTELPRAILDIVDKMKSLEEQAQKIGITTTALQELRVAARDVGVDTEALNTGMAFFGKALALAATGAGTLAPILKANGVALRDQNGNMIPVLTQFRRYADLVKNAGSEQERLLLTTTAFGRNASDMVNILRGGGDAIDEVMGKANASGQVIDEKLVQKGAEFAKVWHQAAGQFQVDFETAVLNVIDAFSGLDNWLQERAKEDTPFGRWLKGLQSLDENVPALPMGMGPNTTPLGAQETKGDIDPMGAAKMAAMEKLKSDLFDLQHFKPTVIPNVGDAAQLARYEKLTAAIKLQLDALKQTDREQYIAAEVARLGADATENQKNKIKELAGVLFDAKKRLDDFNATSRFFGDAIFQALDGILLKGQSAADVLKNLVVQLAEAALQATLLGQGPLAALFGTTPAQSGGLGGILGSVFSLFSGQFAAGGTIPSGKFGVVGEKGPEFVTGPATVTPMAANSNNASSTVNINVVVNGARGNQEIRSMVAEGVGVGLRGYDKNKMRQQATAG